MADRLAASWRAVRAVLAQERLRRAELAFAWAVTAEWALTVALAVVAFDDGGAAAVGLVGLLRMLPSAVGTPVLSALADRRRRERALAAVSVIRAASIGGATALLGAGAPHLVVYALVIVATAAFTVFRPAHSALLPLLCTTTSQLTSANVVRGLLEASATLVGPLVAGALLALSGPTLAFAGAAALSLASAGLLVRIHYDAPDRAVITERPPVLGQAAEGIRAVWRHRDLRWLFGAGFAQCVVRGSLNVFIVVIAFDLVDIGESGVATLSAAIGVGGVVGAMGVSLLVGSRHLGRWLVVALVGWGAPIALIGAVPELVVAFGLIAVIGLANAVIDVPLFTLPVRLVRDDELTLAFGVFETVITIGVAIGSVLAPAAIGLLGLRGAMVAVGLLLPALAALAWRPMLALDQRLAVRDEAIDVLRSTPMLQLLPVPSIEFLAARAEERHIPAGTTLCAQGDAGDSFFVIATGAAEVVGDGVPVRTVGPGEGFGEIALLHDVPRTATVRAREDLDVLEIGREDFLEVVAGHRSTSGAAEAVIAAHLADFHPARVGI